MLKYLLSLLALQSIKATTFENEVDYTVIYNYNKAGYYLTVMSFSLDEDYTNGCPASQSPYSFSEGNSIFSYEKPFEITMTKAGENQNPECTETMVQIFDMETNQYIASQPLKYNNQTNTFNIGFFKPLNSNVIIKSDIENELTICNKFSMSSNSSGDV